MIVNLSKSLHLNKFEKVAVLAIFCTLLVVATVNIMFVADLFGINPATDAAKQVWKLMSGGMGTASAVAWVLGVTIPAWAVPVLAAAGVVSA